MGTDAEIMLPFDSTDVAPIGIWTRHFMDGMYSVALVSSPFLCRLLVSGVAISPSTTLNHYAALGKGASPHQAISYIAPLF